MLAMTAFGLASCPQTALAFNADAVREELSIDSAQKLLFGISFGFANTQAPVNAAFTERASIADSVTFHN